MIRGTPDLPFHCQASQLWGAIPSDLRHYALKLSHCAPIKCMPGAIRTKVVLVSAFRCSPMHNVMHAEVRKSPADAAAEERRPLQNSKTAPKLCMAKTNSARVAYRKASLTSDRKSRPLRVGAMRSGSAESRPSRRKRSSCGRMDSSGSPERSA